MENICRKWPNLLFSLKKLLHLYAKGFITKELLDLHCWWIEELCNQQPLQVAGVSHVLGFVHWIERLPQQYKSIWVLG